VEPLNVATVFGLPGSPFAPTAAQNVVEVQETL
jgi:hypothetical protein